MTTLLNLHKQLHEAIKHRSALHKEYKEKDEQLQMEITGLNLHINQLKAGLNLETIAAAEKVIYVRGKANSAQRLISIKEAKDAIITGEEKFRSGFKGVKVYASFGEQNCNLEYGYGPKHGTMVFEVGLLIRDRLLTDDEAECALYYLENIQAIQEAVPHE
jgi:hypothetical protein